MIRAILFDAGNTLIRMDYAAIAAELERHGARVTPEALQRAEWSARVRLDTDLFAPESAVSTESRDTTERYTRYVLERVGITDPALIAAMIDWRRRYNAPVGLWTVAEPEAAAALARAGAKAEEAAYIGDLYSVDVVGARRVGIRAVLMDPGGCWGTRDCEAAPTVLDAVRLLLED